MRILQKTGRYGVAFFVANPVLVTAGVVVGTLTILVTANTLEQAGQHPSPFFQTRPQPATANRTDHSAVASWQGGSDRKHATAATTVAPGDPDLARVQSVLKDLDLYEGDIDGLEGPRTSAAIQRYQEILGLPATGKVDAAMRRSLGSAMGNKVAVSAPPLPKSAPGFNGHETPDDAMATGSIGDKSVYQLQEALVHFGFHELTVDGVWGGQTAKALSTFQRIEGLAETGEPDEATKARLRDRGFLR
ncbi:peptidoglycan-binding domain-containing protein [Notoacmeibacter ruber]|nr:peptidoglycan-binding protein [Notoacmeibacter ruber]